MSEYFIGVDVGTGSARAGLFDSKGKLFASSKREITLYNDIKDHYEQSSAQIWQSICACVREIVNDFGVSPDSIKGIGFDATCSLVVIGENDSGLPVGVHGHSDRDVIVWMDHRANAETEYINSQELEVLKYVGGRLSPEMETPKLLWLKKNLSSTYTKAKYFFDLTDFLTWKATGVPIRSSCTTTCKWTFLAHENRWDDVYFKTIGLAELCDDSFQKIGSTVNVPGTAIPGGLSEIAAIELGLNIGTAVPLGLIDAHAGGIGTVGAKSEFNVNGNMAYVFGTSACTMTTTDEAAFVPGVWGPYFNAMVPNKWLLEAGQSAAGAAIDQLLKHSPIYDKVTLIAKSDGKTLTQWISEMIRSRVGGDLSLAANLAKGLTVVPEFLGNRAPFADPNASAVISGLKMDDSIEGICSLYIAGILGIGYGLKQILVAQQAQGILVKQIVVSGGAGQDPLVRQLLADTTRCCVVAPATSEPVLLGSAILSKVAYRPELELVEAMQEMSGFSEKYMPNEAWASTFHNSGFQAFEIMQKAEREIRSLTES